MIALQISNIKNFMSKLLVSTTFDNFLLSEASISTYNTFQIDGHLNTKFYSTEEQEELNLGNRQLSFWHTLKPVCFELIKGKKTPLNFKFVFLLTQSNIIKLLDTLDSGINENDVNGLVINIKYDGTSLTCMTGTSLKIFTMDKSLEHGWDNMVKKFLTQQEIPFEEL